MATQLRPMGARWESKSNVAESLDFFFFKAGSLDFYADGPFIKQYCFDSYEMHGGGEARSPAPVYAS